MFLSLENISLFNPRSKEAILSSIDFSVKRGEIMGITGPVASGKTSLLEIMSGMSFPDTGKVLTGRGLRRSMLFENSEDIFSQETVFDELCFAPRLLGWSDSRITLRIKNVLREVKLDDALLVRSPFSLSDGEKRRLAIALFLLIEPDVLFADEPLRGLDPKNKKMIMDLLTGIKESSGITVVIAARSIRDIVFSSDSILCLDRGKISFLYSTEDFLNRSEFLKKNEKDLPTSLLLYNRLLSEGKVERFSFSSEEELVKGMARYIKREKENDKT